ncbi:MAG: DUF4153 domain-containing protein [bacterium]
MNIISLIKKGFKSLSNSLKRFPFAISFSTMTTLVIVYLINSGSHHLETTLMRLGMTLALGFPLSLFLKALCEKRDKNTIHEVGHIGKIAMNRISAFFSRVLAIIFLILYYFILLEKIDMVSVTRYIAVSLAFYLLFLIIPYFYKRENFELYIVKIFSRFFITSIYSAVLFAGLAITLYTIDSLLGVSVQSEFYPTTFIIIIGVFAPIYLLAGIPGIYDSFDVKEDYPRVFEILILYIVMPLITVYTSILYIYFIKILISRQWPEGLVGHLVLWYASISIIVLFLISPLKQKSRWVIIFTTWLPRTIIPLLLMMFTAVWIRINAYGVTENRYFVITLGLWIFGIMLYYVITKKQRNILILLSLAVVALLSVFGPWSSYSVSVYSQNNRFASIVNKYNMTENNELIKTQKTISQEDEKEIKAILRYFHNNHNLSDLKYLPDDFNLTDTDKHFGFPYFPYDINNEYFSHNLFGSYYTKEEYYGIDVRGFDYLYYFVSNSSEIQNYFNNNITIKLDSSNNEILIEKNDDVIYQKSLLPLILELHNKIVENDNNNGTYSKVIDPADYALIEENDKLKIKIVFQFIAGMKNKSVPEETKVNVLNFYLLLKLK